MPCAPVLYFDVGRPGILSRCGNRPEKAQNPNAGLDQRSAQTGNSIKGPRLNKSNCASSALPLPPKAMFP